MKFRKEERTCETSPGWRLATVKEATNHVESIKSQNLLEEWDRALLLDGWIGGSAYDFNAYKAFRSCLGYMLLVDSPLEVINVESDDMENNPYDEHLTDEKGREAALFLCCEDWNYEILCWLLNYWSKSNGSKINTWISPSLFQEIKDTSDIVNKVARHLNSMRTVRTGSDLSYDSHFWYRSFRAMISAMVESVKKTKNDFLDDVKLSDIAYQLWNHMELHIRGFYGYFAGQSRDPKNVEDGLWSAVADAMAVVVIRTFIAKKNENIYAESLKEQRMDDLEIVSFIVVVADRLLDINSLTPDFEDMKTASNHQWSSFYVMLREQGYGTFSYKGQHGVLSRILLQAAKEGEIKLLKRLIEWGVQPQDTDLRKKTALHHAATLEDEPLAVAIANELLKGPSSEKLVNACDHKERTPLHRAAFCGHAQVCKLLLDHKANLFSKDDNGQIPLHYAISGESKNEEVIRLLISVDAKGINWLDWKDNNGITPFVLAKHKGINMVVYLLSVLREPDAYLNNKLDLELCLRESSAMGYPDLVRKLLKAGANPRETDQEGKTALHYAVECPDESQAFNVFEELYKHDMELVKAWDNYGRRVLHIAAFVGHKTLCERLLSIHAMDVDTEDRDGQRAIYYAAAGTHDNDELLEVLIFAGSTNILDLKDSSGTTPLHEAAANGKDRMVRKLLSESLIPKAQDREKFVHAADVIGQTALHRAASGGHTGVVQILLDNGENIVQAADVIGQTAFHIAASGGHIRVVQLLLDNGEKLLLDNGENIVAADVIGQTALHKAASGGHTEVVQLLLKMGAHPLNERDCDGKTALHYVAQAEKSGNGEDALKIAKLLLKKCNIKEQSLLLFACAPGIGSADESLEPNSELKEYLLKEKSEIANLQGVSNKQHRDLQHDYINSIRMMARWGDVDETRKLLTEGYNIDYLRNKKWRETLKDDEKENVERVLEQIDIRLGGKDINLLRVAATLGNIDMTRELLTRGANIDDIRNKEWRENLFDRENKNVEMVVKQMGIIVEQGTDKPARQDNLGRIGFAKGLAALFLNPFVKSPITVGISGEWGMGKSSVMKQTESILLKTSAYAAFSIPWQNESFPGAKKYTFSRKGEMKLKKIGNSIKQLNRKSRKHVSRVKKITRHLCSTLFEESDPLDEFYEFLKNDEPQYEKIYKSLASMDRRDLFVNQEKEGTIPSILTVRYNAWEYRNEYEAWAGLAVVITKELEAAMPVAQRLYNSWKYNWKYNKHKIWRDVIFPCLLVVFLGVWFTIIVWFLLDRAPSDKFKDFKYASFPITLVVIVWAVVKSVMSVVKPISSQMADYLCLPDHSAKLGYQQQVIEDINFLKDEALSHRPSKLWKAFAWIWCFFTFSRDEIYVHSETRMPKVTPASEDQLRMVVFVDDLDRCEENVILKILSAINLVLAVCKIDVILGMDKSMIERAVRRKFEDKNNNPSKSSQDLADKYLRKIVQLPLDLPDPSHIESRQFLLGHLGMLDTPKGITDSDAEPTSKEKEKINPKFRIGRRNPDSDAKPAPEEKEKIKPKFRIGRRNPNPDTAEGADSHLSDKKKQEITEITGESSQCQKTTEITGESSQCGQDDETRITVPQPRADDTEESGVRTSDNTLVTCFRKWRSCLSSLYKYWDSKNKDQHKGKVKPTPENIIPIAMIIPKYTEGEGKAFQDLQTKATGSRKLPREWKRLLNYHRLAWNILSKRPDVTKLNGWQVQLIAWLFVCWEWKDQINTLIQKWHQLDVLANWATDHRQGQAESSGPSLREIVEEYMKKENKGKTSHIEKGKGKTKVKEAEQKEEKVEGSEKPSPREIVEEYMKKENKEKTSHLEKGKGKIEVKEAEQKEGKEEVEVSEKEELADRLTTEMRKVIQEELEDRLKTEMRKVMQEELGDRLKTEMRKVMREEKEELENWFKELIRKVLEEKEQEGKIKVKEAEQEKEKEIEVVKKAEQEEEKERKVEEAEQEKEKERGEWTRLIKTLSKYNVSMDGIQAFQNFRFYCEAGYLPWPLLEE